MNNFPKAAAAILALPGVQSLEREPDGWCCHLHHGWTTAALGGGGTIIDTSLATIRAFVKGAYQLPPAPAPAPAAPSLPSLPKRATKPVLASRLASLYQAAPSLPSAAELSMLRSWINEEFSLIPCKVAFTSHDVDLNRCRYHYFKNNTLLISTAYNSHPFLSPSDNAKFRAVHDWHHVISGADSTLSGEIQAYKIARQSAPRSIWWLLHSEIILQAAACLHHGEFQSQRTVNAIAKGANQ